MLACVMPLWCERLVSFVRSKGDEWLGQMYARNTRQGVLYYYEQLVLKMPMWMGQSRRQIHLPKILDEHFCLSPFPCQEKITYLVDILINKNSRSLPKGPVIFQQF